MGGMSGLAERGDRLQKLATCSDEIAVAGKSKICGVGCGHSGLESNASIFVRKSTDRFDKTVYKYLHPWPESFDFLSVR
jgi:hypothetical protein